MRVPASSVPLALVTGASRRIGRACALALAAQGYAILVHYHSSKAEAESTLRDVTGLGVPGYIYQADLKEASQIEALFSFIDSLPNRLSLLVNSAAIMQSTDVLSVPVEEVDTTFALNFRAPFLCSQHAARRMGDTGLIVNISDIGATKNWTKFPVYVISKAAINSMTTILARALAPGIRVNAIAPGLVFPSSEISEEQWEALVARLPMRRQTAVENITSTLIFLLSNPDITGQVISVDGGYSLI